MLRSFIAKQQPTIEDLREAFGAAADRDATFVHMTAVMHATAKGHEGMKEVLTVMRDNDKSILQVFNRANAVCFTGFPTVALKKLYPEISFWVRVEDADRAQMIISHQLWCKSVRKGSTYRIGDTLHRG